MKVLLVTDFPFLATGYANWGKHLAEFLSNQKDIEVGYLPWFFKDNLLKPVKYKFFPITNPNDKYGASAFDDIVNRFKPDFVISNGDIWMSAYIARTKTRAKFIWINYLPVDGIPYPEKLIFGRAVRRNVETKPILKNVDILVPYTYFAKNELTRLNVKSSEPIYYGYDENIFKRVDNNLRQQYRKDFFGISDNDFLVGCVARNQGRKNIPALIHAWSIFKNKYKIPNIQTNLYLHMKLEDEAGWDISSLVDRYNVKDSVRFNKSLMNEFTFGVPDEQLSLLYNCMDLHTIPTKGEGYGVPFQEAQACGVPNLCTDYSAHVEFTKETSVMIPVDRFYTEDSTGIDRALVDPNKYAELIYYCLSNKKKMQRLSQKGVESARQYTWDKICNRWLTLLQNNMDLVVTCKHEKAKEETRKILEITPEVI